MKSTFKIFLTFVILSGLFLADDSFSQCVVEDWKTSFNGPVNDFDVIGDMIVDDAGNVYITGYQSTQISEYDIITIKYDTDGVQQWIATYNGPGNSIDAGNAIIIDETGNVYITGYSVGIGTSGDIVTIKYNSNGVEQWVARFNSVSNDFDSGASLAVDEVGNVFITGYSAGDFITIKYNSNGIEQWIATYNGPANLGDQALALAIDGNGNVYVTGASEGIGTDTDFATVKYNSSGIEQWVARYNGPANALDFSREIKVDAAANVYITGISTGVGTSFDYATIKYNTDGIEQWVARYNGPANDEDQPNSLAIDEIGNVYVTGSSRGIGSFEDYATVKYNSSGVEQWVLRYNGPANGSDISRSIALDANGNVYVTGGSTGIGTSADFTTIKYNTNGAEQWIAKYNGSSNLNDVSYKIATDLQGNIYVSGYSVEIGTDRDITTIKYPASEASVSNLILMPGFFNFNTIDDVTAVSMNFISFMGIGNVNVSLYSNPPINYSLPPELFVSQYRWIICQTGLSDIDAQVKIHFPDIQNNGIVNPNSVTVYSRPVPGSGVFTPLTTTVSGDTLIATVTDFSEFILVSTDDPLPVDLIAFNANVDANNVTLKWTTAWEENNARFDVQRRASNIDASWTTIGNVAGNGTTYEPKNYSYTDKNLASGSYEYRLVQFDFDGNSTSDFILTQIVEVGTPVEFILAQNFPNPFNPTTKINFQIPIEGLVKLSVFDLSGREVAALVNEVLTPGYYIFDFNGSNLSSGAYFYRLVANNSVMTKRMLMIK